MRKFCPAPGFFALKPLFQLFNAKNYPRSRLGRVFFALKSLFWLFYAKIYPDLHIAGANGHFCGLQRTRSVVTGQVRSSPILNRLIACYFNSWSLSRVRKHRACPWQRSWIETQKHKRLRMSGHQRRVSTHQRIFVHRKPQNAICKHDHI